MMPWSRSGTEEEVWEKVQTHMLAAAIKTALVNTCECAL